MTTAIFLVHAVSTLVMLGVIWFVQVVHYPLFESVGHDAFAAYEQAHTTRITWIVMPTMLAELGAAVALLWHRPPAVSSALVWTGLALLFVIWMSTALVQVPLHSRLQEGFDHGAFLMLVRTNWVRTVAWTARSALVTVMLVRGLA